MGLGIKETFNWPAKKDLFTTYQAVFRRNYYLTYYLSNFLIFVWP